MRGHSGLDWCLRKLASDPKPRLHRRQKPMGSTIREYICGHESVKSERFNVHIQVGGLKKSSATGWVTASFQGFPGNLRMRGAGGEGREEKERGTASRRRQALRLQGGGLQPATAGAVVTLQPAFPVLLRSRFQRTCACDV
ncbi:hypothetical protein C8R44DRAFT_774309 [Mycena epipterygia]|nr:hypothetical protein C8R44DRAFT_774309 [Mycena epipterygia]